MALRQISIPRQFVLRRSIRDNTIWGWLTTVDHKRIGIMYGFAAFFWFLVGGAEALLIREQLRVSERAFIDPELFNQLFTMHGTTMIFLVVMPLAAAFMNLILPLQIGARDVAFPRLNAFSLWTFIAGSIFLNISWLTGNVPNGGWFGYVPNSGLLFNPGHGMSFWALSITVLGIASIAAAINFLVTIFNMRAPGMKFMRLPIFTWMALITSVLMVLAMPIIAVALIQIAADRIFGTNFYNTIAGADPILWQHLFWLFGHPEVYILILPAMGIVSEVIPTFSRKPIFGYPFMVMAGAIIAFLGWFVWSHHMFTAGLGPAANTAFSLSTMIIAIPTGVKIFNWLGTLWGGSIRFTTPMLFALSFILMFTLGGISGMMHAVVPSDAQQHDTYFVVAHFHYVLFGGAIMGIFAGIYYWWPKFTGWYLNDKIGKWVWFLILIGFNFQFAPLHFLGLDGMPRRVVTYSSEFGWDTLNTIATIGGFVIAIGTLLFIFNVIYSMRKKVKAGNDPWDGRTLEWSIPSPPPEHNFDKIPVVKHLDDYWYKKYPETLPEKMKKKSDTTEIEPPSGSTHSDHIHMPDKSYWPLLTGISLTIMAGGFLAGIWLVVIGGVATFISALFWAFEPVNIPTKTEPDNLADKPPPITNSTTIYKAETKSDSLSTKEKE